MTRSPFLQCRQWRGSAEKRDGLGERSFSSGEMPLSEQVKTHSSFLMNVSLGFFFLHLLIPPITFGHPDPKLTALQCYLLCSYVLKRKTHTNFCGCFPTSVHFSVLIWLYLSLGTPCSFLNLFYYFSRMPLSTSPCFLLCFWVLFLIFLTGSYICNHPINVAISPGNHLLFMNPVTPNISLGGSHQMCHSTVPGTGKLAISREPY